MEGFTSGFFTNTKAKESLKKRVTQEGDSCAAVTRGVSISVAVRQEGDISVAVTREGDSCAAVTAMLFLTLYCLMCGIFGLFISHFWVYDVFFFFPNLF